MAACGVISSSDSKPNGTDGVTSNSTNDTSLQTTYTGFNRKPFSSLENSATLSTEKRTQFQSPGNNFNLSMPAGTGNRNISPKCTNNNNNFNKMCNLKTNSSTRTGLQEQPPAKRFASNSNNLSFTQNNTLNNSYNQRTSNFREQRESRTLPSQNSKYMNSPQGSNLQGGKNIQSCSPIVFSGRKTSLNGASQTSSNVKTPDTSYCRESKNISQRDRQQMNKTGNATGSCIDVTPSLKKTCRKFPGPAGILPKLVGNEEKKMCCVQL